MTTGNPQLREIAEAIADLFAEVVRLCPELKGGYQLDKTNWNALEAKWEKS